LEADIMLARPLLLSIAAAGIAALAAPATAGDFSVRFGVGYNSPSRCYSNGAAVYYRSGDCAPRYYTSYRQQPVQYYRYRGTRSSCGSPVVVYDRAPTRRAERHRVVHRRHVVRRSVPRQTVVYRSTTPRYGHSRTVYRSGYRPAVPTRYYSGVRTYRGGCSPRIQYNRSHRHHQHRHHHDRRPHRNVRIRVHR
jgi:hypothetical protein